MHLSVTKTDPRDAVLLSEYGRVVQPAAYQKSSNSLLLLRQKRTLLRQYQKQRVVLLNLLESFEPLPLKDTTVQQSLQQMIAHFQDAIAQLKAEINQVCQADFADQLKRLTSIKGISHTIATALIETANRCAEAWLSGLCFSQGSGQIYWGCSDYLPVWKSGNY